MSQKFIMQTNPASRILVYSSSVDTARDFVGRVKALSVAKSGSIGDGTTESENSELKSTTNPDTISHTLSNKYYTADVHFSLKSMQTLTSEAFHHINAPPALIYVWTTSEPYSEHIQLLSHTMQSMEYEPEVCLGVRLGVDVASSSVPTEASPPKEEENTEIDSNLLSYGFEYVDASRERTRPRTIERSAADSDDDDDNIPDLPRVLDALSTIMWSTMRSTQTTKPESNPNQLDDAEKQERDALLEELLAAGQDVRSSESQATKESVSSERKPVEGDDDDDDEEKLMQQMEAFIKDANALSSFSSYKDFGSADLDFATEHNFSPSSGLGSLDSMFDFAAFTGKTSQSVSRSGSTAPLLDSRGAEQKPTGKLWLDVNTGSGSTLASPLNTHTSTSTGSSHPSSALTASPINEEALDSFGRAAGTLPTITKHGFDDDFTEFVSAPMPQTSTPSTSTIPPSTDTSHLSLPVPSLRRSTSQSSSFASDFGDQDDEHVYAMLDDTSSYGGDDLDRDIEDTSSKKGEENLPDLNEILATTRQLFGGQIPIRNKEDTDPPKSGTGTSATHPSAPKNAASSGADAFDLEDVLNALQRFKAEIGGMTDEEEKKKMAARVALGLVYGLEGQDETEL